MSVLPAAGVISFARGVPPAEILPVEALAASAAAAIRAHGAVALNYGPPEGYGPLREWLGARHGVAPERVLLTPGSLVGLHLLVAHHGEGSRPVAVEAPTYDRFLRVLALHGVPAAPVPRGPGGLALDALEALLRAPRPPALLYVMPTFHNPTGGTLGLPERHALADLAVAHGLCLLEDDPYGLLRFEGEALPSLHALLHERGAGELAILASSFSKSVAPGLRVGYLVLPERLVAPVRARALETYVSPPLLPQAQLLEFLRAGGLGPQLRHARGVLRERRDVLLAALAADVGARGTWSAPAGGYFAWLELHDGPRARELLAAARAEGVDFTPGDAFFPGGGGEAALRLSYSAPAPEEIREGIARLGALLAAGTAG
jgi:2-aminoadipate transaminase